MSAVERAAGVKRARRFAVGLVTLAIVLGLGAWYVQSTVVSPSGLSAAHSAGAKVALDWTDSSDNEDGFIIERRVGNGRYVEIARVAPDVTSYSDIEVEVGSTYAYRVRAFHGLTPRFGARMSGSSNEASVTVNAPPTIAGLTIEPVRVPAGAAAVGILTLQAPATPGGVTLEVFSSDSGVVAVPDVVTVEAGQTMLELPLPTSSVDQTAEVAVVATLAGSEARATLLVEAASTAPASSEISFEQAPPNEWESQHVTAQRTRLISQLTGPGSPARTDERWNIAGTDLGFSFKHQGRFYMVFGDTWGRGGVEGSDWRSNTMAIVEPHPEHGYVITDAIAGPNGEAKELLRSRKVPKEEYTVIPTAGIAVGNRMYLHYMSINYWDQHDWGYQEPVLNGSGLAYSDDGGHTWVKDETAWWPGNSDFGQAAMVKHDGYVYMFGTPAGRFGPAKLLRAAETELLNPATYEYWTADAWASDPTLAAEVVPAPVGELSVRWSDHHQQWFMMYLNDVTHTIVLRTAPQLTGPWSDEEIILTAAEYPHLYAPFMLPIDGEDIYFTMSIFQPDYQVFLMKMTP